MTAPERRPTGSRQVDRRIYTTADLAEATGMEVRDVRRFFRALGFPDAGDEISYNEADLTVLATVAGVIQDSDLDIDTAVRLVRAVGQNVARMSDWQVAAMASRADQLGGREGWQARHDGARHLAAETSEALQLALLHSWRRHVTAALTRLDDEPGDDEPSEDELAQGTSVTVGFADLVNFSALSNELDTNRLGELVEIFEARCGDVVAAYDGRLIKTLGDSVLFVTEDADHALDIASSLIEVIGKDTRLPDVRIGLASGRVVTRMGDIFGPPVNLAARLTAVARRNRVIVDDATVAALRRDHYETRRLTARPLRGFGLVEPVAIRRR